MSTNVFSPRVSRLNLYDLPDSLLPFLAPRDTFDGIEVACTILSCLEEIRGVSGFYVGLTHLIAVLTGANTEKIRRWGHDQLAMYGKGKTHSRPEWAAISRELIRHGYLQQTGEPFTVVEITDQGQLFLQDPQPLRLTKPMSPPAHKLPPAGDLAYDETLFNRLRYLRKALADERDVPAYVVFSDVALRQMARDCPTNEQEFLQISGVGSRKLQEFGSMFLKVIAEHLANYPTLNVPQKPYSPPSPSPARKRQLGETVRETLRYFRLGYSVEQIAKQRSLVTSTIYGHLEQAIQAEESVDLTRLWTPKQELEMTAAFEKTGFGNLTGAKELLIDPYDYGQLRLFRAVHGKNGQ